LGKDGLGNTNPPKRIAEQKDAIDLWTNIMEERWDVTLEKTDRNNCARP